MASFRSRRPGQKREGWWELLKLEVGKTWTGWLAGPVVGVECHHPEHATKACRRVMSDGELACPFCADGMPTRFKCHVPLWSESGVRTLLIMGDRWEELVMRVKHLDPVKVTKTRSRGNAYCCGPSTWTQHKPPIVGAEAAPQDITGVLLKMWADPVLTEWVNAHPVSDTPVSRPAEDAGPPSTGMVPHPERASKAADRRKREREAALSPMAEMFPSLAARMASNQTADVPNGKHAKPKPK